MWKVGLVGTGFWSEKHLQAWSRIPNVHITALCNRSRDKLLAKAAKYGVPEDQLYDSIERMLADADIHVVDIVTGADTHLDFVRKAAAAGKHIMCQKPFAPSIAEAEEIVKISDAAGVRLMVTENWRWLQPFQVIKRVLNSGELGKVNLIRLSIRIITRPEWHRVPGFRSHFFAICLSSYFTKWVYIGLIPGGIFSACLNGYTRKLRESVLILLAKTVESLCLVMMTFMVFWI